MKIISGHLKGRIIPIAKNGQYRPSTGKLKEALFSILTSIDKEMFQGKYILDLFSGTGSLGFESLSRGAVFVTLVDINIEYLKTSENFAKKIREYDKINFLNLDSTNLPMAKDVYDIAFIDPPYGKSFTTEALKSLEAGLWLKDNAVIIVELGGKEVFKTPKSYKIIDQRIIGAAQLVILRYSKK